MTRAKLLASRSTGSIIDCAILISIKCFFSNHQALAKWCKEHDIDLVVIGPEDPLANGIVDGLAPHNIPCFGPTKAGAQIEANKDWSKKFMNKYQIPTARHKSFTDAAEAKDFINRYC